MVGDLCGAQAGLAGDVGVAVAAAEEDGVVAGGGCAVDKPRNLAKRVTVE